MTEGIVLVLIKENLMMMMMIKSVSNSLDTDFGDYQRLAFIKNEGAHNSNPIHLTLAPFLSMFRIPVINTSQ